MTNQMLKVVSDCVALWRWVIRTDFRRSVGLTVRFPFVFHSSDESFNPGEEDDDIAEE